MAEDTAPKYAYIMGDYGNNNSNISYYSPAQSSTEKTPTNEAAPIINSTESANITPENNFTTQTISQLDKFSHSLNHNEPLSTENFEIHDDIKTGFANYAVSHLTINFRATANRVNWTS